MDLAYKLARVKRLRPVVGFFEATRLETALTLRSAGPRIRVPGYPTPFEIRRGTSDLSVFEEIFVDRELSCSLPARPRLIIDGGANVGFSTAFLARTYPESIVIAVEPDATNCGLIRRHTAGLPNVRIVEGALWPRPAHVRIENPDAASWAFRCVECDPSAAGAIPAHTLEQLIDSAAPPGALDPIDRCDLLKLDVEGAEEALFASSDAWIGRVGIILVEIHHAAAMAAMDRAFPTDRWARSIRGEKYLLRRH